MPIEASMLESREVVFLKRSRLWFSSRNKPRFRSKRVRHTYCTSSCVSPGFSGARSSDAVPEWIPLLWSSTSPGRQRQEFIRARACKYNTSTTRKCRVKSAVQIQAVASYLHRLGLQVACWLSSGVVELLCVEALKCFAVLKVLLSTTVWLLCLHAVFDLPKPGTALA